MRDFIELIPVEYFVLHKAMLTAQLDEMPVVKAGVHRGDPVYRIYEDDKRHCREINSKSRNWGKYSTIFEHREKLESMLKQTEQILERYQVRTITIPKVWNTNNKFDCEYFDHLEDGSCSVENDSEYFHNGKHFRSRSELLFATVLDEFGLEYKYDVKVNLMGRMITFDFAIVFREFNRCIFIEYFGRCSDPEYNRKNSIKLECSMSSCIYLGRDLFILSGDTTYTPGSDIIRTAITSIIAQITCYHLTAQGNPASAEDKPSSVIKKQQSLQKCTQKSVYTDSYTDYSV